MSKPCGYDSTGSGGSPSSIVGSPEGLTSSTPTITVTLLPPCRVCGERASGFHYGANTCEACKGFFRRSLQRSESYRCVAYGKCTIGPGRRNACPSCRYNKCLSVGMAKSAIKTGRYTHEKRTQDILEVKKLKTNAQPKNDAREVESIPRVPVYNGDMIMLIDTIIDAHKKHVIPTAAITDEELHNRQLNYFEEYKLKVEMFGSMQPLPNEEYDEIYAKTGIDVDNRQIIIQRFAKNMEHSVRRYINFAKLIPGFTDLSIEDQSNLVKLSRFEFWYLSSFRGFNNTLKVVTFPSGNTIHKEDMCRVWDKDYVHASFQFASCIQRLKLSSDELALIKTICVLFTDRCDLDNPARVEAMQWKVIQCLMFLLRRNHPDKPRLFALIMGRLTALRELTEWNQRLFRKVQVLPTFQDSPLLIEMLTI